GDVGGELVLGDRRPQPAGSEAGVEALGEAGLEETGKQHLVEVDVLVAERDAVEAATATPVDDRVPGGDAQRLRHTGPGLPEAVLQGLGGGRGPATGPGVLG